MNLGVSEEEKLARAALAKIRSWLEKRKPVPGVQSFLRLAIKFCGGCNPSIERGLVARLIREDLTENVLWVSPDEEVDLLLVISGCFTACVERKDLREKAAYCLSISGPRISDITRERNGERGATGN